MPPQNASVIYLPPGVVVPAVVQQGPGANAVPFDRAFFEQLLPQAIASFCSQVTCDHPVVEILTVDGATHYINGISGVADAWVALHTSKLEHEHPVQVFLPYQTIFRVELHPCSDEHPRRLGFNLSPSNAPELAQAEPTEALPAPRPNPNGASTRTAARKRNPPG